MATTGDNAPEQGEAPDELDLLRAENDALKQRLGRRLAWRKWLALLLVVLTTLSVVAATLAVWAHRTVFDTNTFMDTVGPALDDPAFFAILSQKVSDQAVQALDLETKVANELTKFDQYLSQELLDALNVGDRARQLLQNFPRPSLADLAPPITDFLESRIRLRADQLFTSAEFMEAFPALVRRAHEVTVALVRGDIAEYPNVYIQSGEVRLNLIPLVTQVLQKAAADLRGLLPDITLPDVVSEGVDEARQQLQGAIQAELPDDFGQVTIMSEDRLDDLQNGAAEMDRLVWVLVIVAILLVVLTFVVSPTRRRTAFQLGLGVVIGLVIAMVVMRQVDAAIEDQLTDPNSQQAAGALFGEVMSSLRQLALIVAIAALVVAIGAYLVGRPAWVARLSERTRRLTAGGTGGSEFDRWVLAHYDLLRIIGIGIAVVAVFLIGLDLVPLIIVAAVLALYLWALWAARSRAGTGPATEQPAEANAK